MQPANPTPLKKSFFIIITILLPILFIFIVEFALRVLNIGPDISLFSVVNLNGKKYYQLNPNIGEKYFPSNKVQIQSPDIFSINKAENTFRIFCLGGSTVTGYPYYYNASFSSFLRERLHRTFPGKNFEIINLGMTAINSYMVLDMAMNLPEYEPDLIIVYDGHNEFYGPLGAASQQSFLNSRWINNIYLQLLNSRIFLLMRDGYNNIVKWMNGTDKQNSPAITMELLAKGQYIPYQSKIYKDGLNTFEQNLEDLTEVCSSNNIPLILSTQVSNLRDQLPFISGESNSLSETLKHKINEHLLAGDKAGSEGKMDTALNELRKILAIDSLYAAAHYGIASCLDIKGEKSKALAEYIKARDYDELRFRASTDFNNLIISMKKNQNVGVADIEKVFMAYSTDSLIGNKLILEHLHPNSYGQFLIAKELSEIIKEMGALKEIQEENISDTSLWNERSVSELDEKIALRRTEIMTSTWPFVELDIPVAGINKNDTLSLFAENVAENKWGWGNAHVAAIEFYKNKKDWKNLEREYKVMMALLPNNVNSFIELASFYIDQHRLSEAKQVLIKSMLVKRTDVAEKLIKSLNH